MIDGTYVYWQIGNLSIMVSLGQCCGGGGLFWLFLNGLWFYPGIPSVPGFSVLHAR